MAAQFTCKRILDETSDDVGGDRQGRWTCGAASAPRRGCPAAAGEDLESSAGPPIRGPVQRHLDGRGWIVRPPRRVQDLPSRAGGVHGSAPIVGAGDDGCVR